MKELSEPGPLGLGLFPSREDALETRHTERIHSMGEHPEVSQVAAEAVLTTASELHKESTKLAPIDAVRKVTQVSRMFARIVPTYDLMNRLMSAGQDQAWRQLATALAAPPADGAALDVATGTGDLAIALARQTRYVVGVDVCEPMLEPAAKKVVQARPKGQVRFMLADALALPFQDASFDCVTVAFGVRNMTDLVAVFQEMRRVVRPGGRVVCLEIMRPRRSFLGICYKFYLTRFIPMMGGLVSRDPDAYRYLATSVLGFNSPEELRDLMQAAGFSSVTYRTLNFATIALHVGIR